jgi:hypothetical protein
MLVTVIFGRNDPNLNPEVAHHISELFKNAELYQVDQTSHWRQWDRPDVVADLIKRSIRTGHGRCVRNTTTRLGLVGNELVTLGERLAAVDLQRHTG